MSKKQSPATAARRRKVKIAATYFGPDYDELRGVYQPLCVAAFQRGVLLGELARATGKRDWDFPYRTLLHGGMFQRFGRGRKKSTYDVPDAMHDVLEKHNLSYAKWCRLYGYDPDKFAELMWMDLPNIKAFLRKEFVHEYWGENPPPIDQEVSKGSIAKYIGNTIISLCKVPEKVYMAQAQKLPLIAGFGFSTQGAIQDILGRVSLHRAIDKTYRLAKKIPEDSGDSPTSILLKAYREFGGKVKAPTVITAQFFEE
ncbi:MAG: hypothetical protein RBR22_12915 [Desulfuromonas sp.]|jgi:hypothetical protein|nr:hypothetical protein [Desulfuromonas sp.]